MSLLDGWLQSLAVHHHDRKQIELTRARTLARDWRLGWYVAPRRKAWQIGKMTVADPLLRFTIVRDDGSPLYFSSVEHALEFFRKEFGIFGVAMFQS